MVGFIIRVVIPFVIFIVLPVIYIRGLMKRAAKGFSHKGSDESSYGSGPDSKNSIEMVKDEVCGKYVLVENAVSCVKNGNRYYFCSESCRDKFVK